MRNVLSLNSPLAVFACEGFPLEASRRISPGVLLRVILHTDSALIAWRPEQELVSFTSELTREVRPLNVSALLLAPWWRSESVSRVSELRLASGCGGFLF